MDSTSPQRITLTLLPLTTASWSRFGTLPDDEQAETRSDLEFLWNDGNVNFIAHNVNELAFANNGRAICDLLNRHETHTQTLMPMNADAYIVVAPADIDFSVPDHLGEVRAFRIPQYVPVHLARGTWHWGPYPIDADTLRIFNIQGRGYINDNAIASLSRDHHTIYEVAINE